MFKIKGVLAGAILALGLISAPIVQAQTNTPDTEIVKEIPPVVPDGVLGYYTTDGGKTFIPIKEKKGVAERILSDMSKEKFMESYKMTPEAEAKIVHQVPPAPITIDGITLAFSPPTLTQ
jgi:hypothetical protein